MRRQNSSCDQCRKGKRACDAALFAPAPCSSAHGGQEQRPVRPCSYCHKTKKHCTTYWASSQFHISNSSLHKGSRSHGRRGVGARARAIGQPDASAAGLFNVTQVPGSHDQDLSWLNQPSLDLQDAMARGNNPPPILQATGSLFQAAPCDIVGDLFAFDHIPIQQAESLPASHAAFPDVYTDDDPEETEFAAPRQTVHGSSRTYQDAGSPSIASFYPLGEGPPQAACQTGSSSQSLSDWPQISDISLSPFSPQHVMTFRTHNNFISQNLMHVYHDVLEHSLSCWVSEVSCPYKMPMRNRNESPCAASVSPNSNPFLGNTPTQQEWGDVWSNRIYSRVIKLDRAAQTMGMIRLTRSEDQAASRALHLSIMAFSAQWAQKSCREQEQYSSMACESDGIGLDEEVADEFDRQIQRSLWWQARHALDGCAELECYRVVCAELIFGLTQKPWDKVSFASGHETDPLSNNKSERPAMDAPIMTQVQTILSRDGPPIFIERGVRKAYALKYMMDVHVAGLSQPSGNRHGQSSFEQPTAIDMQDRQTIGLLYWLAVMFDTVSGSMNQRPVIVADQDCQHDAADDDISAQQGNNVPCSDRRWAIHLFMQDDPRSPTQPLRWPCPYNDAASAVTRSGPVKILLYRHVNYLQDAIRRGYRGEPIEEIIRNAVLIFRYWNTTYGVFFRDLIQHYDTVPPRIRSWFSCILAHWHLAALILADLLERVDGAGLGEHRASEARAASRTVETIRRTSADELADLARIVTPPDQTCGAMAPPQLPGFHAAVGQGTILTEPWTAILIRAFSKAFAWHFAKAQREMSHTRDLLGHVGHDAQKRITARCTDCIRALWQLGKKSDMARTVAETLGAALAGLEQS